MFLSSFKHFLSLLSLFNDRIALNIDTFHGLSFLFHFSGFFVRDLLFKQVVDDFLLVGAVDGWRVEDGLVGFFLRLHLSLELSLPLFDHDLSFDVGQPLLLQKFLPVQFCCFLFLLLFQQFFLLPPILQFPHCLLLFFIYAESTQRKVGLHHLPSLVLNFLQFEQPRFFLFPLLLQLNLVLEDEIGYFLCFLLGGFLLGEGEVSAVDAEGDILAGFVFF